MRQSLKTPFDRNVITHFEAFGKNNFNFFIFLFSSKVGRNAPLTITIFKETVMDYGFNRLGLDSNGEFLHPVCFTEGPANPNNSRLLL